MTSDEGKGIKGIKGIQKCRLIRKPKSETWAGSILDSLDSFDSFVLRVVIRVPLCYLLWVRSRNPFLRDVDRE